MRAYLLQIALCCCWLFPWATLVEAAEPQDSLRVQGSVHGTAAGKQQQTLFKLYLHKPQKELAAETYCHFYYSGSAPLTALRAYISATDCLRDPADYQQAAALRPLELRETAPNSYAVKLPPRRALADSLLYVCVDVSPAAQEGDSLSLRQIEMRQGKLRLPLKHMSRCARRVFKDYKALYVPGDYGSKFFRIPALICTQKGSLLALADRRKESQADLPEDIDVVLRRSVDQGKTWSAPIVIAEGKGRGKGFGDAAVVQAASGRLICVFVGGPGLWQSRPEQSIRTYVSRSSDDGLTWSAPQDITEQVLTPKATGSSPGWWGAFAASGKGCVSSNGRVLFAIAVREGPAYSLTNYALYSDDEGESWKVSGPAFMGGDESKIIELAPSQLLMSIRNKKKGERQYNLSYDNGESWGTPASFPELIEPACNGAILRYTHPSAAADSILLHSIPYHLQRRERASIFISRDNGKSWPEHRLIYSGVSAYSDLEQLPDGDVLMFLEEDDPISLVYIRMSPSFLFRKQE